MARPQRRRRKVALAPTATLRALRESETRYRVLAEQSSLGIVIQAEDLPPTLDIRKSSEDGPSPRPPLGEARRQSLARPPRWQ
jgi:hypothetical protein